MKTIFFSGVNSPVRDGAIRTLAEVAASAGLRVVEDIINADLIVCVDYSPSEKRLLEEAKRLGKPRILIKQEPPIVLPAHRFENPGGLFTAVITRGSVTQTPIFATYQTWDTTYLSNYLRKEKVVAITANKWSAVRGQLYVLRRQLYATDSRIVLYGHGWKETKIKSAAMVAKESLIAIRNGMAPSYGGVSWLFQNPKDFQGSVADKAKVMSEYKVSLVIENWAGYMSEKLVDSILAGTIPVYVGPNPEQFGIPDDLFVWSSPKIESIQKAIDEALSRSTREYIENVQKWISTPGVKDFWENRAVSSRIIALILSKHA